MIKAILCDMDGTLVDTERYYTEGTFKWMKDKFAYSGSKESIYKVIGITMEETCTVLRDLLKVDKTAAEIMKINDDYFENESSLDYREYIFPEVTEAIHEIKGMGIRIAICSASPRWAIEQFVRECGLTDQIDYIVSAVDCKRQKPDPDIYLDALSALGVKEGEAIVFEDSYSGISAGKNAGILTVARRDYRFGIDQSRADICVDDMQQLIGIIKEINHG